MSRDTWAGINNPGHIVQRLLDLTLNGEAIDDELLLYIAKTSYGDITNYPARQEIWGKLKPEIAAEFLNATAEGWWQRFISEPAFDAGIEEPLEARLLDPTVFEKHLDPTRAGAVAFGLRVFERFSILPQYQFGQWLSRIVNVIHQINVADSILLGKLVKERRWRNIVSTLFDLVINYNRNDLVPALVECENLLDWYDSIRFRWSGKSGRRISWDDWWLAFTETAIELYPYGPEEMKIWERSGGDMSVIETNQPGRSGWQHAITRLKNGGGGKHINTTRLLHNMSIDYPRKDKLDLLQQMWRGLGGRF